MPKEQSDKKFLSRFLRARLPFFVVVKLLLLFFFSSCSQKKEYYVIGYPKEWSILSESKQSNNFNAFNYDLIESLKYLSQLNIQVVMVENEEDLAKGLNRGVFDGILTYVRDPILNQQPWKLSKPYIKMGEIFIVSMNTYTKVEKNLGNNTIGILRNYVLELQKYEFKNGVIKKYDSAKQAIEDIKKGNLFAFVLDLPTAFFYTQNLYEGQIKIASDPINDSGAYLAIRNDSNDSLITFFNDALERINEIGYDELIRRKWDLPPQ